MKGEWCYYKNYFSADFCQRVIDLAVQLEEAKPFISNNVLDESYRKSKIRWIPTGDSKFQFLFNEIWNIGTLLNNQFFNFDVSLLPSLQFTEYDEVYAGEYKSHQDVFWVNQSNYHRKVSIVVQLTDPSEYVGGNLEFQYLPEYPPAADILPRGTVIAFPSFIFHKVTPITKGKRYSLVGWFEGPKFK